MVVAALIGIWFYRTSKMNGLNAILWAVLGVASYFVGKVIAGVFIGIISPEMIDETMKLTLIGLVAGIVAVLITYWLMQMAASKKKNEKHSLMTNYWMIQRICVIRLSPPTKFTMRFNTDSSQLKRLTT
ncbi:MAG: hypothetical protein HYZ14_13725 [Bacteroidetes bacterium]|nr:hypothetical protein [Bacteroidota bacterium]